MAEFHGVILALEFLTGMAIVGVCCALVLVAVALAHEIKGDPKDGN